MLRKLGLAFLVVIMFMSVNPLEGHASSKADDIVSDAHNYIGSPYQFGGTTPSGFDCSGYIQYVFAKHGESIPRTTSQQFNSGEAVSKSNLIKGDLVFFNTSGNGVSHSGIYIGNNKFIHASSSRGVTVTDLNDPWYWGSRYIGARRYLAEETPKASEPKEEVAAEEVQSSSEPTVEFSRAEMAIILADELGLSTDQPVTFDDVDPDSEAAGAIAAATEQGIFNGFNEQEFRPDTALTRAQVAALFVRAYDLETAQADFTFPDVRESHWAFDNVNNLVSNGIIEGYPDGTYRPAREVSEEEFYIIIDRLNNMD